jgi:hypothetical protein
MIRHFIFTLKVFKVFCGVCEHIANHYAICMRQPIGERSQEVAGFSAFIYIYIIFHYIFAWGTCNICWAELLGEAPDAKLSEVCAAPALDSSPTRNNARVEPAQGDGDGGYTCGGLGGIEVGAILSLLDFW